MQTDKAMDSLFVGSLTGCGEIKREFFPHIQDKNN